MVNITAQLCDADGKQTGTNISVPVETTRDQLEEIVNDVLSTEEKLPYAFYVNDKLIGDDLKTFLEETGGSTEELLKVTYLPQALFRVRAVTRCSHSIPGHTEAVLAVQFSPDGRLLATGSGDKTVRIWDVFTATPRHVLSGHRNWVLIVSWSPCGTKLATGGMDNEVIVWNAQSGKRVGRELRGHKKWVTAVAWEPFHRNPDCRRLASSSKDGTVRIWDTTLSRSLHVLSGHTSSATSVRWGGQGLLYTCSQDRTVKIYQDSDFAPVRTLKGHAHWVNSLALNTDYVLRTGPFDNKGKRAADKEEAVAAAARRFGDVVGEGGERVVSGSDDFTLILWDPACPRGKEEVARMTGHRQLVNHVCFSPDGRTIASGSFDHSVKVWNGKTGAFMASLFGHVEAVYQVTWSADSRMLLSGSKDSTIKLWDTRTSKLKMDLPGHADEVFAVDWAPDGERVGSGGRDRVVKLWMN